MKKILTVAFASLCAASAFAQTEPFGTYTRPFAADSPGKIPPVGPLFGADTRPAGQNKPSVDNGPYYTTAIQAAETHK
ncbi:MAG: hypothetical protein ABW069_04850, partial [Duganella sp.]